VVKYWEIIADRLCKAGWSLGWVSAIDSEGRTIWIVDAHRDDGRRFIVRADEKLTASFELELAIRNIHPAHNTNPITVIKLGKKGTYENNLSYSYCCT
jgi:hypothetical protein